MTGLLNAEPLNVNPYAAGEKKNGTGTVNIVLQAFDSMTWQPAKDACTLVYSVHC